MSGICKKCRYLIKAMDSQDSSKPDAKPIAERMQELTLVRLYYPLSCQVQSIIIFFIIFLSVNNKYTYF